MEKLSLLYALNPSGFVDFQRVGFVDRLFARFREMSKHYGEIHILSADVRDYSGYLPSNCYHHHFPLLGKRGFSSRFDRMITTAGMFSVVSPFLYANVFARCDVYEARYLHGVIPLFIGKCLFRKPIIVWFPWWWAGMRYRGGSIRFKIARLRERLSFPLTDLALVSTRDLMKLVQDDTSGKVETGYLANFVDTEMFSPRAQNREATVVNVLSVGSLTARKNHRLLLQAVSYAQKHVDRPIQVTLIGSGIQEERLRKYAEDQEVALRIVPRVANSEIPTCISRSDIFMLTSRAEGNPKALMEAMSCGAACIGTNVSGVRDLIQHNENGVLCEERPDSLARAICDLLTDRVLRDRICRNARRYIVENYSLSRIVEKEAGFVDRVFHRFGLRQANRLGRHAL